MPHPNPTPDRTPIHRIIDRHIARLMHDLEQAACPKIYRAGVKAALRYLKDDLLALEANGFADDRPPPVEWGGFADEPPEMRAL
jgi:hypothetical protein